MTRRPKHFAARTQAAVPQPPRAANMRTPDTAAAGLAASQQSPAGKGDAMQRLSKRDCQRCRCSQCATSHCRAAGAKGVGRDLRCPGSRAANGGKDAPCIQCCLLFSLCKSLWLHRQSRSAANRHVLSTSVNMLLTRDSCNGVVTVLVMPIINSLQGCSAQGRHRRERVHTAGTPLPALSDVLPLWGRPRQAAGS